MTSTANAVLGQAEEPGHTLVFRDDTDLAGTPVPELAADLRKCCAWFCPLDPTAWRLSGCRSAWQL